MSDSDSASEAYESADEKGEENAWALERSLPLNRENVELLLKLKEDELKKDLQLLDDSAAFLPPPVYDVVALPFLTHCASAPTDGKRKQHPLLPVFVDVLNTLAASSFIRYLSTRCRQALWSLKKETKEEDRHYCKLAEQILKAIADQLTRPNHDEVYNRLADACDIFEHKLQPVDGKDFWDFKQRLNGGKELSARYIYELVMHFLMRGIPLLFASVAHDAPERPLTSWFAFSTDRQTELRCVQWNDRKHSEKWQFVPLDVPIIPMPKYRPVFFENTEDSLAKFVNFLFHDIYTIANDWDAGLAVKGDKHFLLNPICPPRFLLFECEGKVQDFPITKALRGPFAARPCANGVAPSYCVVAFLYEDKNGVCRVGRWKENHFVESHGKGSSIKSDSQLALRYLFLERAQ